MPAYELTRAALREGGFFATQLARRLASDPVGLIDVGARWGISEEFAVGAPLFSALAFEPDPEEAPRVADKGRGEDWASFAVEATALGRDFGTLKLNVYSRANNSSIHRVSEHAKKRYNLGGFDLTKILSVPAKPLDAIVFGPQAPARAGEVIKLDTQGAELEVICGGARTFKERTVCLITEAHFFALYDGAPYFADLDQHLRQLGFTFIGFSDFQNRSSKRLDKRTHWGRERLFQADAIYLRDPALADADANTRVVDIAIFMALLLGFFDLALEWAALAKAAGLDTEDLVASIDKMSAIGRQQPLTEVEALLAAIRRHPDLAHVLVSKFVDGRRDFATFHDISAPA